VHSDIFKVYQSQIADLRRRVRQRADGREAAAWENEALNKVHGSLRPFVESFVDRDALNEGQPMRLQ